MSKTFSDEVENCKTNCKPTSTAMFDNADSSVEFEQFFESAQQANDTLARLTQIARDLESDPCQISSQLNQTENGVVLNAQFAFSCQAEAVIFQMRLR